jgi:putative membrane-bound dehydrogenase-like protein
MTRFCFVFLRVLRAFVVLFSANAVQAGPLRAGAFALDITPTEFPVIVNGGFVEAVATKANDRLHARALVLQSGETKIAIVVVDSCMLPRELCDDAKARAQTSTGIPADRILISATHTHTAPSAMGCLGSDADEKYVRVLPGLLATAIEKANARLAPAKIGWTVVHAPEMTATRRYVHRLDRPRNDPFGEPTVFANMHPGYNNPDAIGPTGPTDPGVSVVSVQHADGRPLAVLANFSMHYVGTTPLSADYYGLFCEKIAKPIAADESFVGIMSQGTSGDAWLADYSKPQPKERWNILTFSTAMADKVHAALKGIEYRNDVPLAMREAKLKLKRRTPDEKRLAWAKERVAKLAGAEPKAQPDIYAREAIFLHEDPERELKLQAIRIGDIGIAAIPNEVYALTGLKLKAMSPLPLTFNVSLANGSEGYIPPAEQHPLGGYTTWPARTAALETAAETKIVETVLGLLEDVSGARRKQYVEARGTYADAVLAGKPLAYYSMAELGGPVCLDATGNGRNGAYESGVLFHLPGVDASGFQAASDAGGAYYAINRAAHFASGRMKTALPHVASSEKYSVEFWFWNGLSNDARPVTAYLVSRGPEGDTQAPGDHLGIGGTHQAGAHQGKLIFYNGNRRDQLLAGKTPVAQRAWNHAALVRDGAKVSVYLNGQLDASGAADVTNGSKSVFFGGRCDGFAPLEGKLDEIAVFDRPLTGEQIATHYKAASVPSAPAGAALKRSSEPLSPQESLKKIHVLDDYVVELVAAEPLVIDPVAIDWAPDAKLWVVEMHDYPYGMDGKGKPGGRVKFLEDADGDGKYDKATLFMDNVRMPTGVLAWRDGILVTAAPEILYARDTDRDGKADHVEVLYSGFKEGNPQLRVNGLRWGLDGWVYCANGWSAGIITSKKTGQKLDLKGKDLRIRPDTGEMELVSGVSQFGRERDDWGNWFGLDNAHPLFHYVFEERYLKRNPHVAAPDAKIQLLGHQPRVYPRSVLQRRYIGLDHHGHYTSACGLALYRDDLLFTNPNSDHVATPLHAFICEPVHNLIQHHEVFDADCTFGARRAENETGRDFLASEDPWFRPVMTRAGPDGALWVVDMYRYMVEHPDWLDAIGKKELVTFYRDGDDRGRIYRVHRKAAPPRTVPRLAESSTQALVAALESPSGHTRDQAQMLLMWRADATAAPHLARLVAESRSAAARVQALCTLEILADTGAADLNTDVLLSALRNLSGQVRRRAVRVAERRLDRDEQLLQAVCSITRDQDLRVIFQVALALGETADPRAGEALAKIGRVFGANREMATAVLSSATKHAAAVSRAIADSQLPFDSELYHGLIDLSLATGDRAALAKLLDRVVPQDSSKATAAHLAEFARLLDALPARKATLEKLREPPDELSSVLGRTTSLFNRARDLAADTRADPKIRAASVALLGRDPRRHSEDLKLLAGLLSPLLPGEVPAAAVRAAARTGDPSVPAILLKDWATHPPALRIAVADALLARQPWALHLARTPAARDIDFSRKQRLLNHPNADVKKAAKATLDQPTPASADRQKVIDEYQSALTPDSKADLNRGKRIYVENCATCHRSGGEGNEIGPSLLSVRDWTKENLLAAILDPDRTVEPRFVSYTVTAADDQSLTGVITSESAAALTIKTLDAKEHQVPRPTIKSLSSTGRSLMPQGFESAIPPADMRNLITFIQSPENR